MKHTLFFAVGCLLVFTGFNAAAQETTAPLPPPDQGILRTTPLPPVDEDAATPAAAPAAAPSSRTRQGTQNPSPAQSGGGTAQSPAAGTSGTARKPETGGSAGQASAPAAFGSRAQSREPAAQPDSSGIPDKGWYFGGMLGGNVYGYHAESASPYSWREESINKRARLEKVYTGGGFNVDLFLGRDFGLLAGQVEFLFSGEFTKAKYTINEYSQYYSSSYDERNDFTGLTLQIPVMVKLDLHWGRFMFQPQAGVYLNFGLGDLRYYYSSGESIGIKYDSPLFGWMSGVALGFRVGRGYLFADLRYSRDLGKTKAAFGKYGGDAEYTQDAFMLNMGYQYYFKGKK
jgi:hypothetical protein